MKQHKVTIAKRDFSLVFSLGTLERMEQTIPDFNLVEIDSILTSTSGLLTVLYLLAQEGAIADGKPLDVSREWFGAHIPASKTRIVALHQEIVETLVDGMEMESDDEKDDQEVDVVLEEMKKKGTD